MKALEKQKNELEARIAAAQALSAKRSEEAQAYRKEAEELRATSHKAQNELDELRNNQEISSSDRLAAALRIFNRRLGELRNSASGGSAPTP